MTKQPKLKKQHQFIFAIVITIINLIALTLADPMQENISHIANVNAHPWFVILWASSFAVYLFLYTPLLTKQLRYHSKIGIAAYRIACLLMIISILIPYNPDEFALLAKLHINTSMFATIFYVLIFLRILYKGYFTEPIFIQHILPIYLTIVGSGGLLFLLMGCVSTLLEILFVIEMSWFLFYAMKY